MIAGASASATTVAFHGKVVMEDGSVPNRPVAIERDCGNSPQDIATTNRRGEFLWHADVDSASEGMVLAIDPMEGSGVAMSNLLNNGACVLRAALRGFESSVIELDDLNSFSNPVLPVLVLSRAGGQANFDMLASGGVPHAAAKAWNRAVKSIHARNWPEAERELRASVAASPKFARGWNALGSVLIFEQKAPEAREVYRKLVALHPKTAQPYLLLVRLDVGAHDWNAALETAGGLIRADSKHQYPEAHLYRAIARYELKDLAGAETAAAEAIRLDRFHDVPSSEYVYGLILESRGEHAQARRHMAEYLNLRPNAPDAPSVRARMENVGKAAPAPAALEMESVAASLRVARAADAWVPGGRAGLSAAAHISGPATGDFFGQYCRAIAVELSPRTAQVPLFLETLRAYISAVSELSLLGRRIDDHIVVAMSLAHNGAQTRRILGLLGWRVNPGDGKVEPGDQPADEIPQSLPPMFGIDELKMQQTLESGGEFRFEIDSENAPLTGGGAWADLLKDKTLPIATAFATDARLARTCAGLAQAGPGAAPALLGGTGLRTLVVNEAEKLARDGEAFAVSNHSAATPGDPAAWKKLAGADPADPPAFFRAVLEKDGLADYYHALWRADAVHRRFFLDHADRFYPWDRDAAHEWGDDLFEHLPLDSDTRVHFPGGRHAWTNSALPDDAALLKLPSVEALLAVARVEDQRGTSLDESSASLLARRYGEWRALFPYFEKLPGLGRDEFAALDSFTEAVKKLPEPGRNAVLGEWDALVELIVRGARAGSLDARQSARAFRDAALALAAPGGSRKALEEFRAIGGADDDSIASRLLRLASAQRAGFDRVLELEKIPRLKAAKNPADISTALAGIVYAASLDPDGLLVNEDDSFVSRHRFSVNGALFPPSALVRSPEGSYWSGTFAGFESIARTLAPGGAAPAHIEQTAVPLEAPPQGPDTEPADTPVFRASGRLVEVYVTVTDSAGHHIDDLARDQFRITDNGASPKIVAFEPRSSEVSVALLLDTTGSMMPALPALKNAALKLIGDLRPSDSIAVYSFNDAVHQLQPFTVDKDAAKRAVLRTQALGQTALYDALTRVGRDLSARGGKKVIVVFTDGHDNASTLTPRLAIERAKAAGIPVYTIAQGEALTRPDFLGQLSAVAQATGGVAFAIREPAQIRDVFEKVSADLTHGYLLVFQPPPAQNRAWRTISVTVHASKPYRIRARDGYYPE